MPNEKLTEIQKSYLAGFIDGEGCIFIKRRNENSTWLQLMLVISQKDINLLKELKFLIDEKCYLRLPSKNYTAGNLCYTSGQAYRILKQIYPYLKLKKEQAKIGIEFYEKYKIIPIPAGRKKPIWQSNSKLWEEREICYHTIKALKKVNYVWGGINAQ